jgi:hypothetical protein
MSANVSVASTSSEATLKASNRDIMGKRKVRSSGNGMKESV